jgi:hypothetical protein
MIFCERPQIDDIGRYMIASLQAKVPPLHNVSFSLKLPILKSQE